MSTIQDRKKSNATRLEWTKRNPDRARESNTRSRDRLTAAGLCTQYCGRPKRPTSRLCAECSQKKIDYLRNRYNAKPAAKKKMLAYSKKWRKANPGYLAEWRAANPDKVAAQRLRRQLGEKVGALPEDLPEVIEPDMATTLSPEVIELRRKIDALETLTPIEAQTRGYTLPVTAKLHIGRVQQMEILLSMLGNYANNPSVVAVVRMDRHFEIWRRKA